MSSMSNTIITNKNTNMNINVQQADSMYKCHASKKDRNHACTLCCENKERFEITGTRLINEAEKVYQLCVTCTRQLRLLSTYKPADVKKRRQFWEDVWVALAAV